MSSTVIFYLNLTSREAILHRYDAKRKIRRLLCPQVGEKYLEFCILPSVTLGWICMYLTPHSGSKKTKNKNTPPKPHFLKLCLLD